MMTLYFQRKFIFSAIFFFYVFCTFDSTVFAQDTCIWVVVPGSTTGSTVAALTGVTSASACQAYCITSNSSCSGVSFDPSTNYCYVNQLSNSMINFNSSTTATYYGLIKGLGVTSCYSATTCTWTGQKDTHSFAATQVSTVTNVNDCVSYCNGTSGCVALEWNYVFSQCWVYNPTLQYPPQPQDGIYFFTNPNCMPFIESLPSSTPSTTTRSMQQGATSSPAFIFLTTTMSIQQGVYTVNETPNSYLLNGFWNSAISLQDCLTACYTSTNGCSSIDWATNYATGQQCLLHVSTQSGGVQPANGINHYALSFGRVVFAWSPFSNTKILGGIQANAASLSSCEITCQAITDCQSINWASNNNPGQQCSLLFTQSNQIFAANVTHYDLFNSGFCIWVQNSASGGQPSFALLQLYQYNCYTLPGCFGLDCTTSLCSYSFNGQLISGYNHYSFQCIGSSGSTGSTTPCDSCNNNNNSSSKNSSNCNNNNNSNNAYLVATIVLAIVFLSDHSVYS